MSKEKTKVLHLVYGIVLSILLIVTAVMCVVLCYKIYKTGPSPFTRETVSKSFAKVSILVYSLIALVIGGGVISVVYPLEKERVKASVKDSITLHKLLEKLPKTISSEGAKKIEKQRIIRFSMVIISCILLVFAIIGASIQSVKGYDAGSENVNDQMLKACLTILGYFAAPLLYLIVTVFVCKYSVKKELVVVKNELQNKKDDKQNDKNNELGPITKLTTDLASNVKKIAEPKKWHKIASLCISIAIFVTALIFIIVGITNGGMKDVATKAINICTECIGMG